MTSDIELHPDFAPAPTTLFTAIDPAQIVAQATRIAEAIKPLIERQHLFTRIHGSDHVQLEGWTLAGSLMPVGVFPITVRTWEIGEDAGYGACAEARTMAGAMVGRAEAVVMRDEEEGNKRPWERKPRFQLISMAQTRASSKALRMPLGFVMKLAGYEATPAEEMEEAAARGETVTGGKGVRPGWRDIAEQQHAHADLGELIDRHGLRKWVADWCDSKGYVRPLAKGQFNQLRRAIERELEDRAAQPSGPGPASAPPGDRPGSDTNASAADPGGGNDATQAGREPSASEAPTSDPRAGRPPAAPGQGLAGSGTTSPTSPGDGKAGRGRSRRGGSGNAPAASEPPPAVPSDEAEQAAFEQTLADDDPQRWVR